MENRQLPQKMKVTVEEVRPESNEVYLNDNNGNEGWFAVKSPANIKYAKVGPADVTLDNNAVVYLRNTQSNQSRGNSYPSGGYKKEFKPFRQSNPVQANEYQPEEKESKRIGVTKEVTNVSLEEIRIMYNSLSMSGKWIVATNIFPRLDKPGKYDCMYFISEKREGFDPTPYMQVAEKAIDEMVTPEVTKNTIKETNMGTY